MEMMNIPKDAQEKIGQIFTDMTSPAAIKKLCEDEPDFTKAMANHMLANPIQKEN